jgi:hypothetical protein
MKVERMEDIQMIVEEAQAEVLFFKRLPKKE